MRQGGPDAVEVELTFDFLCSWCWIGHRRLLDGIRLADLGAPPNLRYRSFQVNPAIPPEGLDRKAFRTAKFGSWARAQARDAEVTLAGAGEGIEFRFDRLERAVSSHRAHRLLAVAQREPAGKPVDRLIEETFRAYFTEGRDISSPETLAEIAARTGMDPEIALTALRGDDGEREVQEAQARADAAGVRAVPLLRIDGLQVSGAQPAPALAETLRAAEAARRRTM